MYKILCDNTLIYTSEIEELALIDPVVELEENCAGSFSFVIPPDHPYYDLIQKRKTVIQVYQDEELIFSGMPIETETDFYKQKYVFCEGELSYLNDSIQRPARYQGLTVRSLLEAYISNHNAQVEEEKQFTVGQVSVVDPNDYIYCYTNMESTMECLKEDLCDDLGGYFRIRHENGVKYIDYLADSTNTCEQVIELGKNLVDFKSNLDSTDIATAIIPLGATLESSPIEGLDVRLDIKSVNGGLDYVCNQTAIEHYGYIYKTVVWDAVTVPANLKTKGEQYLSDIQFENMIIEAKAVDLHFLDDSQERFRLSDRIRVVSSPHGLDRNFRLTKQTINLNNSENDTITLGKKEQVSLSAKTNQVNTEIVKAMESITPASTILQQAKDNATALIQGGASGGYIVIDVDEDGEGEFLIMDTPSKETATKVWRWNANGLGYSGNGYSGNYETAITIDGKINAAMILTNTMLADMIRGGTLKLGGYDNQYGNVEIYSPDGILVGNVNKNGFDYYLNDSLNNKYEVSIAKATTTECPALVFKRDDVKIGELRCYGSTDSNGMYIDLASDDRRSSLSISEGNFTIFMDVENGIVLKNDPLVSVFSDNYCEFKVKNDGIYVQKGLHRSGKGWTGTANGIQFINGICVGY